jgi:hypothetical protein
VRGVIFGTLDLERKSVWPVRLRFERLANSRNSRPELVLPKIKTPVFQVTSEAGVGVGCNADGQCAKRITDLGVALEVSRAVEVYHPTNKGDNRHRGHLFVLGLIDDLQGVLLAEGSDIVEAAALHKVSEVRSAPRTSTNCYRNSRK